MGVARAGRPTGIAPRRTADGWFRRAVPGLLVVAFVVRLAAIVATPHLGLAADAHDYDRHAQSIATGHGFPTSSVDARGGATAIRPPAFPYLLAAAYAVVGHHVLAGRILEGALGIVVVALIALISKELWGPAAGVLAAGFAALFPPLVVDGLTLMTEPLFITLELAAVLAILRWRGPHGGRIWLISAGVLVGLSMLTRSNGDLLLIPLAFTANRGGSWRSVSSYQAPAILLACAALVVLPWTIRNAVELKSFVPVSDQDGYTLAGTYNATSRAHAARWIVATQDPAIAKS